MNPPIITVIGDLFARRVRPPKLRAPRERTRPTDRMPLTPDLN
jgi:hypothetical protein